jgi:hypothetical protein
MSQKWSYPEPDRIALHEAAHAVCATLLRARVKKVSIAGNQPICSLRHFGTDDPAEQSQLHGQIAMSGIEAEIMFFHDTRGENPSDRGQVKEAAYDLVNTREEAEALVAKWRANVVAMLHAANEPLVRLAVMLTKRKVLTGREVRQALRGIKWPPRKAKKPKEPVGDFELEQ